MNLVNLIEKINKLPQDLKDFFSSGQPGIEIKESCESYGIDDLLIENIIDSIGMIIIGDVPLENLPYIIWENTTLEKGAVYGLSSDVTRRIFLKFPEYFVRSSELLGKWELLKKNPFALLSKKSNSLSNPPYKKEEDRLHEIRPLSHSLEDSTQLPLREALRKYPEIEQQLITFEHIRLPDYPEKVRPSIKNWLSDFAYYQNDDSNHEVLINGYLEQSPNVQNLQLEEKAKLKQILTSFNNNSPLRLNQKIPEIIFDRKTLLYLEKTIPTTKSAHDKKLEKEASGILSQLNYTPASSGEEKAVKIKPKKTKRKSLTEESAENYRGSFRIKVDSQEDDEKKEKKNEAEEVKEPDYKKLEEAPFQEENNGFKAQEFNDQNKKDNSLKKLADAQNESATGGTPLQNQNSLPASQYMNEQNWQNNNAPLNPLRITPYFQGGSENSNQ